MCVNLGSIPGWLISPVSAIGKAATGSKAFDYLDPTAIIAKEQDKKIAKQQKEEEKRNAAILGAGKSAGASPSPFTTYTDTSRGW